jgi:hypothetical protein
MILWFTNASKTFGLSFCMVWKWLWGHYGHLRKRLGDREDKEIKEDKARLKSSANPKAVERRSKKGKKKKKKEDQVKAIISLLGHKGWKKQATCVLLDDEPPTPRMEERCRVQLN